VYLDGSWLGIGVMYDDDVDVDEARAAVNWLWPIRDQFAWRHIEITLPPAADDGAVSS
jgi:hypothetical protein